jgi:arabinose-5-phosphate isomerase
MTRESLAESQTPQHILDRAAEVLALEAQGILGVRERLGESFVKAIEMISGAGGRVIVSGIGKSGIIGRKISATLNSTGTRSFFLHPVEAAHGDLGQVDPHDVVLALSNSGETKELTALIPSLRAIGCRIIALTGAPGSTLARLSDLVLDVGVAVEACPLNLAPTASTTALLAAGDALAVVLLERNRFSPQDFKRLHPGGLLGRRLSSRVSDLIRIGGPVPAVSEGASMQSAVSAIDRGRLGAVLVTDGRGCLAGIITDGDVRRMLVRHPSRNPSDLRAVEVMSRNPLRLPADAPAYDALNLMERHQITVLPIADPDGRVLGILHLHDILGKGEFEFSGAAGTEPPAGD